MNKTLEMIAHDLRVINDNMDEAIANSSMAKVMMAKIKLEKLLSAIEKTNEKEA